MKLIGQAFPNGRIDFLRQDNTWAFAKVDSGMRTNQKDRIRVDPAQASIELQTAANHEDDPPDWLESMQQILGTADSIYLQYRNGVLRFRRANHDAGQNRQFITLGNQEEFTAFVNEHWKRIRYLYATRRESAFCFDINTMVTHRSDVREPGDRIELDARMDLQHPAGQPQITFDATGSGAPLEIIEWRSTVRDGEAGRFAPENRHIELSVRNVQRPFTMLHEHRPEFKTDAYTLNGNPMAARLKRLVNERRKRQT